MRIRRQVATCIVVVAVAGPMLASCGSRVSSGAPPLRFCGQTLWAGASGAMPTDATSSGTVTAILTSNAAAFIELTHDCTHGATISVRPPDGATVVRRFRAGETGLVAIEIRPVRPHTTVTVERADRTTTVVHLPHR